MFETTITISNVEDHGDEPWPTEWIVTCGCTHYAFCDDEHDAVIEAIAHGRSCAGASGYELCVLRRERFAGCSM